MNLLIEVREYHCEYCVRVGEQVRYLNGAINPGVVADVVGELVRIQVKHRLLNPGECDQRIEDENVHSDIVAEGLVRYER